jgi:hypothetical protein
MRGSGRAQRSRRGRRAGHVHSGVLQEPGRSCRPFFGQSVVSGRVTVQVVGERIDPPHAAAGYKSLTITGPDTSAPRTMSDPDGNQLLFVPRGHNQVDQIEFQVGVSDVALFDRFYGDILGVERIGDGRYRLGRTILAVSADSGARQVKTEPLTNPLDAVAAMSGIGFRYLTIRGGQQRAPAETLN